MAFIISGPIQFQCRESSAEVYKWPFWKIKFFFISKCYYLYPYKFLINNSKWQIIIHSRHVHASFNIKPKLSYKPGFFVLDLRSWIPCSTSWVMDIESQVLLTSFWFLCLRFWVLGPGSFSNYCKVWQKVIIKCDRYYSVWQEVITKSARYHKVWQLSKSEM